MICNSMENVLIFILFLSRYDNIFANKCNHSVSFFLNFFMLFMKQNVSRKQLILFISNICPQRKPRWILTKILVINHYHQEFIYFVIKSSTTNSCLFIQGINNICIYLGRVVTRNKLPKPLTIW